MKLLPHDRVQRVLFLVLVAVFIGSCIAPPYREFLLMQHAPTVLGGLLLASLSNRFKIKSAQLCVDHSFSLVSIVSEPATCTLNTPYDEWSQQLFGVSISETFSFQRNHYDRLVHFSYGLLIAVPIQEVERRYLNLSAFASAVLAVECILATSAAYELAEWMVAIVFTPTWAEQFLGHQGDPFDAHKDMALATAGAILSVSIAGLWNRLRGKS